MDEPESAAHATAELIHAVLTDARQAAGGGAEIEGILALAPQGLSYGIALHHPDGRSVFITVCEFSGRE